MTKIVHNALVQPDRSRLRKMSANTVISSQIQMKKRKNHNIDQNTWPTLYEASKTVMSAFLSRTHGQTRGGSNAGSGRQPGGRDSSAFVGRPGGPREAMAPISGPAI